MHPKSISFRAPAVKSIARLDVEQNISFMERHQFIMIQNRAVIVLIAIVCTPTTIKALIIFKTLKNNNCEPSCKFKVSTKPE